MFFFYIIYMKMEKINNYIGNKFLNELLIFECLYHYWGKDVDRNNEADFIHKEI